MPERKCNHETALSGEIKATPRASTRPRPQTVPALSGPQSVLGRLRAGTAGLAIVAALLTGCGGDGAGGSTTKPAAAATAKPSATPTPQEAVDAVVNVSVGDNFYKPKDVTIVRGQSVKWRNQGGVAHTVTSGSDSSVKFDSGTLNPGGGDALKPGAVGKVTYSCTIHGKAQSGTITITR